MKTAFIQIGVFVLFLLLFNGKASANPSKPEGGSICLTMMVKNQSKTIQRCLDSVRDVIDCYCICDTGSTDDTIQIIERYFRNLQIPGKVCRHEWINFGHNRTLSAEAAQEMLRELNFSLPRTYLLTINADMIMEISPEFRKNQLWKDSYLLGEKSLSLLNYNTRLIKASLPWKSIGVAYEYWNCGKPVSSQILTTLKIDNPYDSECQPEKFERNIVLLTKGLAEEPQNPRYMFYLAQSYKALKQYDKAIKWYKERIKNGGDKEEVWHAKCMLGDIYEGTNQWENALNSYLEAFQSIPDRAEPLAQIAHHYRINGQLDLAYLFAKHGSKIPYPKNYTKFISEDVYHYKFDEELSIAAYYTPFRQESFEAEERLLLNRKIPSSVRYQTERNMQFYVKPLKNVRIQPLPIDPPCIEGSAMKFNPMNPTIFKTNEGYAAICRCVNYLQEKAQHYRMIDPEVQKELFVKTRNFLLKYDKDFNILSQREVIDEISSYKRVPPFMSYIDGLEDCRIFTHHNKIWATCTAHDLNSHHIQQIALFSLSDSHPAEDVVFLDHFVALEGPDPKRCEKNWLPFSKDEKIFVIYSYDPLIVYEVDKDSGACKEIVRHEAKKDFTCFRGSAGPIPFEDGYLAIVHHVGWDEGRFYFHRFLFLDKDFKIAKMSKSFTYQNNRVEFCGGMTVDHSGNNLIMTVGIEDRDAILAFVDLDTVSALLEPVE